MDEYFSLHCTAIHGDPPITFRWLFRNETLYGTNNIRIEHTKRSSTLNIESVSGENVGNYTCIAFNRAGTTNTTTELIVRG